VCLFYMSLCILPAIKDDQAVLRCGHKVISWAEMQGFNVVPCRQQGYTYF
jgi:hypothetical protein